MIITDSPSRLLIAAYLSRVSDATNGWAPTYAAVMATNLYPKAPPTMDFNFANLPTSSPTINVFEGRLNVNTIMQTGIFKLPIMTFYTKAGKDKLEQKFSPFSGAVSMGVDITLGGKTMNSSKVESDYEDWPNAVEATFLSIVQPAARNQPWGCKVIYSGDVGWQKTEVSKGGEGFVQQIQFSIVADVIL